MAEMTSTVIVDLCKRNGGYRQPHLNDQLYLQCRGFRHIQNLEPYINCKALWLDQNAISDVENLSHFKELATLFLQDNSIRRLNSRCFEGLQNLRILNLSNNHLSRIHGLESVPLLETLEIAKNRFESLEAIRNIFCCPKLSSVDVSYNMIEKIGSPSDDNNNDGDEENAEDKDEGGDCPDNAEKDRNFINTENAEKLVAFWSNLPELGVLYLHGNELPRRCKFYRKRMIIGLPQLMYLDERPIFPDERRTTEAWGRGGNEAEDAERTAIREEKVAEMEKNVKSLIDLKCQKKEVREEAERERVKRQEEIDEWRHAMQVTYACERTEMDHLEYEQRGYLESEEAKVFEKSFSEAAVRQSLEYFKAAEERRRLEEEVQRELELEEKRIEQELQKKRDQMRCRHEEMKKAIDMFKETTADGNDNDDDANNDRAMLMMSKEEALEKKRKQREQEEHEVNEKAAAQLREESNKAFYTSMQPKSESEVIDDLFVGEQKQQTSPSSASAAASDGREQQKSSSSKMETTTTSAMQMLSNSSDQIEKDQQQQQQQKKQAVADTSNTKKKGSTTTHWDAFLAMEKGKGKRRF